MKEKLLELTAKVGEGVYERDDSFNTSLILRDVIKAHTGWDAEVVPCSVTVRYLNLDMYSVVKCNGYLCDATASQIPGARAALVAECDERGWCQVGDIVYGPCVDEEHVAVIAEVGSTDSYNAVEFGLLEEEDLKALLTPAA